MEPAQVRLVAKELQVARSTPASPLSFHGASMEPVLVDGDEIVTEPVAWEEILTGDIIVYRFDDSFPARRVIAKRAERLLLACDNWPMARFEARREDVLARAIGRRRNGTWLWHTEDEWRQARRAALFRYSPRLPLRAVRVLRRLLGKGLRRFAGLAGAR